MCVGKRAGENANPIARLNDVIWQLGFVRNVFRALIAAATLLWLSNSLSALADTNVASSRLDRGLSYHHEIVKEAPWSIHIIQVERSHSEFEFHTALAGGRFFGLSTLTEQLKL